MGQTQHAKAVGVPGGRTGVLCVCLVLMLTVPAQCEESDAYPSYPFLSKIASDELSEKVVQRVAGELAKDRLARQFGPRRQIAIRTVATRMVSTRRFEARVEGFEALVVEGEKPPLDVFPDRYLSTDGLFDNGRRYADKRMVAVIVDHWLRQTRLSHLELTMWDASAEENPGLFPPSMRFLLSGARVSAGRIVGDVRRQPYRLIDQLAGQYVVKVRTNESKEDVLQRAVRTLIEDAGLTASAEFVLYTRIKLQTHIQDATMAGTDRSDRTERSQIAELSRGWQYPCDWDAKDRDRLRLATGLLSRSGIPVEALNETDLGLFLLYVIGLPDQQRSKLERSFEEERVWLRAEGVVDDLVTEHSALNRMIEDLRTSLAQPRGFDGNMGAGASAAWVRPIVMDLEDDLRRRTLNIRHASTSNSELLVKEALAVLSQRLESTWQMLVTEQIRARQTRIIKLNAADLGDLQKLESFSGWPLREQVRLALEESLRRQGWSQTCLENYFISLELAARAEQLAGVVMRVLGN